MKGINRSKHFHLIKALINLKELIQDGPTPELETYQGELEKLYKNYERILKELSIIIDEYEEKHTQIKVQYLGRKLKALKKELPVEKLDYHVLIENIWISYNT